MELSKQMQILLNEAEYIYETYFFHADLEHDGHAVFKVALEATRRLTLRHGGPLAFRLAQIMTDQAVAVYESANPAA